MAFRKRQLPAPDLSTQVESLFDEVWKREREQDFQRRIDRAAEAAERAEKKKLDKVMVEPKPSIPKAKKKTKDDGKSAPDNAR